MELRPPELPKHDQREQPAEEARGGLLEEALVERWKSDAEGIYRHLPEPDAAAWTLDCGHELPLLQHERPDDPPSRPRLCPVCRKMRNVTDEPGTP